MSRATLLLLIVCCVALLYVRIAYHQSHYHSFWFQTFIIHKAQILPHVGMTIKKH